MRVGESVILISDTLNWAGAVAMRSLLVYLPLEPLQWEDELLKNPLVLSMVPSLKMSKLVPTEGGEAIIGNGKVKPEPSREGSPDISLRPNWPLAQ